MRSVLRVLLPFVILALAYLVVSKLLSTPQDPKGFQRPPTITRVEGRTLKPESYQVIVNSQGTVVPCTESTLIPEVPGKIIEISPSLREGGFFETDDILLKIDPLDYETRVVVAQHNLAQAKALIEQEKARAQQALENWARLGKQGTPGALALRKPQLAEAEAKLAASEAELAKAKRDLERTIIRAPYAGRILEKQVDVGQYVSNGTVVAMIYAIDYVEVRLPIKNEDLGFVNLPEDYRNQMHSPNMELPEVTLAGNLGGKQSKWTGKIVRVAGALESRSRQLFAVAQVDDPYSRRDDGTPPLKIGLFVQAEIQGQLLTNVFILPRNSVRANDEIILIDADSKMRRRKIHPLWSDRDVVVVGQDADRGIVKGEVLCTTPIAFPADGAPVLATIDGKAPPEPKRRRPGAKPQRP